MKANIIILFFVLLTSSNAHADQYLCISEKATGFEFNKETKSWNTANFNVQGQKYIISKSKVEFIEYEVKKFAEKYTIAECMRDFTEKGFLDCDGPIGTFKFNRENGRFLRINPWGYLGVSPFSTNEGDNSPFIEIGKCSPF